MILTVTCCNKLKVSPLNWHHSYPFLKNDCGKQEMMVTLMAFHLPREVLWPMMHVIQYIY